MEKFGKSVNNEYFCNIELGQSSEKPMELKRLTGIITSR